MTKLTSLQLDQITGAGAAMKVVSRALKSMGRHPVLWFGGGLAASVGLTVAAAGLMISGLARNQ
jgi:hypothetical protein